MTHFVKERPPEKRFVLRQIHGNCLEKLGVKNVGGGYAIIDQNIKPEVGDLVHCLLNGANVGSYIKQVKEIKGDTVIVGTAYLDESKDFTAEADEILGVVLETYGKTWGYREYVRPPRLQDEHIARLGGGR